MNNPVSSTYMPSLWLRRCSYSNPNQRTIRHFLHGLEKPELEVRGLGRRGLAAPRTVGHALYWHLRAEMMACMPKVPALPFACVSTAFLSSAFALRFHRHFFSKPMPFACVCTASLSKTAPFLPRH